MDEDCKDCHYYYDQRANFCENCGFETEDPFDPINFEEEERE